MAPGFEPCFEKYDCLTFLKAWIFRFNEWVTNLLPLGLPKKQNKTKMNIMNKKEWTLETYSINFSGKLLNSIGSVRVNELTFVLLSLF